MATTATETDERREATSAPQSLAPEQVAAADRMRDQARGASRRRKPGRPPKGPRQPRPEGQPPSRAPEEPKAGSAPESWRPYWGMVGMILARFGEPEFTPEELTKLCELTSPAVDKYGELPWKEELALLGMVATIMGPRVGSIVQRTRAGRAQLAADEARKAPAQEKPAAA